MKACTLAALATFPDRTPLTEDVLVGAEPAQGEGACFASQRIVALQTHRGGGAFGPPTGRTVRVRTVAGVLVRDGLVAEEWMVRDHGGLVAALGADPDAAAAALGGEGPDGSTPGTAALVERWDGPGACTSATPGSRLSWRITSRPRSARATSAVSARRCTRPRSWIPATVAGVVLGTVLAAFARGETLTAVFGTVALVVSVHMAFARPEWRLSDRPPRGLGEQFVPRAIGTVSAMMGIGGGTPSVPRSRCSTVRSTRPSARPPRSGW